jgi:hypothetical protein
MAGGDPLRHLCTGLPGGGLLAFVRADLGPSDSDGLHVDSDLFGDEHVGLASDPFDRLPAAEDSQGDSQGPAPSVSAAEGEAARFQGGQDRRRELPCRARGSS